MIMIQERNVVNGVTAVFLTDLIGVFEPLKWFAVAALILIFADLRFGIQAAHMRGEPVRFSRALRRTINKLIDYVCWILVAGAFGKAFGASFQIEFLPAVVLLVIYGIEINSCFSNYFEAHGKHYKFDIFKYFAKKGDIIEPEEVRNDERPIETDSDIRS